MSVKTPYILISLKHLETIGNLQISLYVCISLSLQIQDYVSQLPIDSPTTLKYANKCV